MSTPANAREARLQYRFEQLTSGDAQLIAAQPDPSITAALKRPRRPARRRHPHRR